MSDFVFFKISKLFYSEVIADIRTKISKKTDSFRTYCNWKINSTFIFVSLCSGLKLVFLKSSKKIKKSSYTAQKLGLSERFSMSYIQEY